MRNNRGNQNAGKPKPVAKKADRKGRNQRSRRTERDDSEDKNAAKIDQIEQDQIIKARPTPTRYEPQQVDFSTLQQTWPSLPTGVHGRSSAVLERLASLSERYPNGYIPPYELGRRLWKGKSVLFYNEAEKAEALAEVSRLSQARADAISQRKGDLVEPKEIKFSAVASEDSKKLLETYALGKYPELESGKDQPAVFGAVLKNLRSNGTYETTGKRPQFLAKVESLLASGRVKRT